MSKLEEYLEAKKPEELENTLNYFIKYIDKIKAMPEIEQQLLDIKKQVMKTKLAKSTGYISKTQQKKNEKLAEEISRNFSVLLLEQGGWDYWNKKLKLGLTKSDYQKDFDEIMDIEIEDFIDRYGLDSQDDITDKEYKQLEKDTEKILKTGQSDSLSLFEYEGLKITLGVYDKLDLREDGQTHDLETAKKVYKILFGKEYK